MRGGLARDIVWFEGVPFLTHESFHYQLIDLEMYRSVFQHDCMRQFDDDEEFDVEEVDRKVDRAVAWKINPDRIRPT